MDEKISAFPILETFEGDEYIPLEKAGKNYRAKYVDIVPIGNRNPNGGTIVNDLVKNKAVGENSFVAGKNNVANGNFSAALGESCTTSSTAVGSLVCGENNVTTNVAEFACGRWNQSHTGDTEKEKTLYSIGFGEGPTKANAFEVMGDGSAYLIGVGGYNGGNPGEVGIKTLQDVVNNTFDASKLFAAAKNSGKVVEGFRKDLENALKEKKICYIIDGTNQIMLTFAGSDGNGNLMFITSNGTRKYEITLDSANTASMVVSLVGDPINRFAAEQGASIFDLEPISDNQTIKVALITNKNEVVIPDAGDVFKVMDGDNIATSGVVISKTSDAVSITYIIRANNFEEGRSIEMHIKFGYEDSVGLDSIRVLSSDKYTINPSMISEDYITGLENSGNLYKQEATVYNISQIEGNTYNDLRAAISALNVYMGDRPKYMGLMIEFVTNRGQLEVHLYTGRSFVDPNSWTRIFPFNPFN